MNSACPSEVTDARATPSRRALAWQRLAERLGSLAALGWLALAVVVLWFLPADSVRVRGAAAEALAMGHDYAREHIVLCLIPALLIAGAIRVLLSPSAVLRFLGPGASRPLAYATAAVSGAILSVCSCTILPLFAGIWQLGAGLGPATTFLFSGPAINLLAIVLTARVLGLELGIARAVSAVVLSVLIGLAMSRWFRSEASPAGEAAAADGGEAHDPAATRAAATLVGALAGVLVFANWSVAEPSGLFGAVASVKWYLTGAFALAVGWVVVRHFAVPWAAASATALATLAAALAVPSHPELAMLVATAGLTLGLLAGGERALAWLDATWELARQIVPLLLIGVVVAGFLLGRPGHEGLIPSSWVAGSVGGSSLLATLAASLAGALMYFATLTEVPILQGLLGSGMGQGPALALLLAGPALSLPSLLALRPLLGTKKTLAYLALVVVLSTLVGYGFGLVAGRWA